MLVWFSNEAPEISVTSSTSKLFPKIGEEAMPEQLTTNMREKQQEQSWWPQENSHRLTLAVGDGGNDGRYASRTLPLQSHHQHTKHDAKVQGIQS